MNTDKILDELRALIKNTDVQLLQETVQAHLVALERQKLIYDYAVNASPRGLDVVLKFAEDAQFVYLPIHIDGN